MAKKNKGKHRKRAHEEPEEESFKEYKKPRPTDEFGNDIPSDGEVDDGPVEASIDFGGEQSSAAELFEMAKDQQQQGEAAAVVQKLLEAALEQFEKEDKAAAGAGAGADADGSTATIFKYQFGSCLLELAGTVLHKPYAERAIEVFKSATDGAAAAAAAAGGGGGGGGAAASAPASSAASADADDDDDDDEKSVIEVADLLEAQAHAWLEIARIEMLMDDDDDDGEDDAEEDTAEPGEAAVAKAAELHQQCVGAVGGGVEGQVAKQLGFSQQLQRCAEDVKDDPDAAAVLLEQAVVYAKAAITLAPADKAALQQHGACLNSLGKVVEEEAAQLQCFTDAVAQLRAAAGNTADPEAEAANMQLLSSALLQLGQRTTDDEAAEALLGEGFELLEKAAAANPSNAALQNFMTQLSAQQGGDAE